MRSSYKIPLEPRGARTTFLDAVYTVCSDLAGKAVGVPVAAHAHVVGVEGEDGLQAGGGAGGGAHLHTQPF
jgi:hypothetical protein